MRAFPDSSEPASSDSPRRRSRKTTDANRGFGSREKAGARASPRKSPSVPIVIVDANPVFRAGLVITLSERRFRVIAACSALEDLAEGAFERCRLALISLDQHEEAILSRVASLAEQGLHVVILSERFQPPSVLAAMAAGADGYLLKNEISADALVTSL